MYISFMDAGYVHVCVHVCVSLCVNMCTYTDIDSASISIVYMCK